MHAIPSSIFLTVSVDDFDKICLFVNIILAVSLHSVKLNLMYGTGDYEVVHSCWNSEVTHSTCVCNFIRYILYFQEHSTLLLMSHLHWLTVVGIMG